MGVSQGHRDRAVAEQVSHRVERYTGLHQARGKVMTEIVPAKCRDAGALEKLRPRGLESGADFKDTLLTVRLSAPTIEQTNCLVI